MKDYSVTRKEQKSYVLSYEIKGNKIVMKMADGTTKEAPYSELTEQAILSQMESQVKRAKKWKELPIGAGINVATLIGLAMVMLFIYHTIPSPALYQTLMVAVPTALTGVSIISFLKHMEDFERTPKEVEKLNYFVENKDELSSTVNEKEKVMDGLSSKATKQINKEDLISGESLTVNNIDKFSLKDLKTLRDNIHSLNHQKQEEDDFVNAVDNAYKVYGKKPNNK